MVEMRKAAMTAGALKRKSDPKKKGEQERERRESDKRGDHDKERERKPSTGAVDRKVEKKSPSAPRKKVEKAEEFSDEDEVLDL